MEGVNYNEQQSEGSSESETMVETTDPTTPTTREKQRSALLMKILSGEQVDDGEFGGLQDEPWELPDEVVAESLCAAMMVLHKDAVDTMEQVRAVALRARMVAEADADKEVRVIRPMGTLAGMLWKKVDGFCSASEAANAKKLLKGYNRLRKFTRLWRGVEEVLQQAWDAREIDEQSEQAAEIAGRFVESLTNAVVKSDQIIYLEGHARHMRLPKKERLLIEAAGSGLHKRRAEARRDALVKAMGSDVNAV